ncbi:hypothetical protein GCM10010393_53040 [Streptomyces gobitricini]|uniref:Uncharacterized protein n=1 Tax=Streptomyces gobitricini TaxID=68211 RepID=A0ABN3N2T7_9ACTN
MEPATAIAATAAIRDVRGVPGFAAVVQRVVLAVMVGFLRRVRELPKRSRTHHRVLRPRVITASCHSDWPEQGAAHVKIG